MKPICRGIFTLYFLCCGFAGRIVFSLENWEKNSIVSLSCVFTRGFAGRALPGTMAPPNLLSRDERGLGSFRLSWWIKFSTCHVAEMN